MEDSGEKPQQANGIDTDASHPAREMSLHMLRMLETRLEAAGIVLQAETQRIVGRVQLQMLAAAAVFISLWGGIVLLAIALPPHLRVPVLSGVVGAFVLTAVVAFLYARRMQPNTGIGSVTWFVDALKLDLDVLARSLAQHKGQAARPQPEPDPEQPERSQVSDAA
jgi:uncharacterized membrane protein YqjE